MLSDQKNFDFYRCFGLGEAEADYRLIKKANLVNQHDICCPSPPLTLSLLFSLKIHKKAGMNHTDLWSKSKSIFIRLNKLVIHIVSGRKVSELAMIHNSFSIVVRGCPGLILYKPELSTVRLFQTCQIVFVRYGAPIPLDVQLESLLQPGFLCQTHVGQRLD